MTTEQAYIDGFCKVAEYHGIDPEALAGFAKEAAVPLNLIGKGLQKTIMAPTWNTAKGLGKALGGRNYTAPETVRDAMILRTQNVARRMSDRLDRIAAARKQLSEYYPKGIPAREAGILDNLESIASKRLQNYGGGFDLHSMQSLRDALKDAKIF